MVATSAYTLSPRAIRGFIRREKIVTESAKTNVLSVVRFIAGHEYKGSWWGLPQSSLIYNTLAQIRLWDEILVCRLVKGKITYVYYDTWPCLVRLADEFPDHSLSKVVEIHTEQGAHKTEILPLDKWASKDLLQKATVLTRENAIHGIYTLMPRSKSFFRDVALAL